ncbi:unnamed protein product [Cylindrotheca closterium]|uniref:Mitochondrial carrier protein n=1 Tax=Cylindrotheca closterium TaxID=2856 RepID=A0AAD2JGR5_9STRA|nr:unnamed protein product [Cylindrotheca closterium]
MVFGLFDSHEDDQNNDPSQQQEDRLKLIHRRSSMQKIDEAAARSKEFLESDKTTTSPTAVRNSFIAGWTAGVTGTLAGHPLDSLKVWVQTGIRPAANPLAANANGMLNTVRRYYSGVGGPLVTVGLLQSINFAVYDTTRRFVYFHIDNPQADPHGPEARDYLNQDSYTSVGVAGFAAGSVLSLITSPILMVKTMQQTRGMKFQEALRMTRANPATGFGVHFAVETLNRSVYFCTYEYLKRYFEQQQLQDNDDAKPTASLGGRMISAAAAGINCWAWLYPADALRSRMYAQMAAGAPISTLETAKIMYAENGVRSFYRGFTVTTLRAGPVAAAILPVYDYVLDTLNTVS